LAALSPAKSDSHLHWCYLFSQTSFVVEVDAGLDPAETWLDTQHDLLSLLQSEDANLRTSHFQTLELLRNMLPDAATAKKMQE